MEGEDELIDFDTNGAGGLCAALQMEFEPARYALVVRGGRHGALDHYALRFRTTGPCGDGVLNIDEECDDGDRDPDNECSLDCRRQAVCGNGTVEDGETCDDGGRVDGDGCDADCALEPLCGNGQVDASEECDDANDFNGDGCDVLCSLEEFWIVDGRFRRVSRFAEGTSDTFYFYADGPSQLEVFTQVENEIACRPAEDTVLTLYGIDAMGQRIELFQNDDGVDNPPCSRLNVDVAGGEHVLVVHEGGDDQAVNRYTLGFTLTREISFIDRILGALSERGSDVYTFTLAQAQAVNIRLLLDGGPCAEDVHLSISSRGVAPIEQNVVRDAMGCPELRSRLGAGIFELTVTNQGAEPIDEYILDVDW